MNNFKEQAKASITLDKRRAKKDGTFPVKIYVWKGAAKKGKFYGTTLSLSEREFHSAWETLKPRKEFQGLRKKLALLENMAQAAIDELEHFTFEAYERKAAIPKGEAQNVFWHYAQRVAELRAAKQVSTADNYHLAAKSIREFADTDTLLFQNVTPKFLQGYEDHMVNKGRSLTTVSIYIRTLRTIFNDAINTKDAKAEDYPFGRRKYVVPASTNPKKALTGQQLRQLMNVTPATDEQAKARQFFFFSYASNGMNMKDIALLKWSDMEADRFTFIREKTKRTKKDRQSPITVYLTDFQREMLETYGTDPERSEYVFPILNEDMDAEQQHRAVKRFTRYVNQHLETLCKANNLPKISTYWARHSFATVAVLKGASMEFMRESLGHSEMKTTLNYFAGFDDEAKKEFASTIMDF
ncbi:MAG: site-specific integrase [Flavobacteriales bacterium]|nr:site-specific integrase [Flavobacteriales bacterium]